MMFVVGWDVSEIIFPTFINDIIRIILPIFLPLLTINRLKSETKSLFPKHKTFETFILAEIAPQRCTPQELVDPEDRYSLTLPVFIL